MHIKIKDYNRSVSFSDIATQILLCSGDLNHLMLTDCVDFTRWRCRPQFAGI